MAVERRQPQPSWFPLANSKWVAVDVSRYFWPSTSSPSDGNAKYCGQPSDSVGKREPVADDGPAEPEALVDRAGAQRRDDPLEGADRVVLRAAGGRVRGRAVGAVADVVLGVAAGHDHQQVGVRRPGRHVAGDAARRAAPACADLLVELDVAGGVDDRAALVVDDLAVAVEADVAVEEDRPVDLEHARGAVPGQLAHEHAVRPSPGRCSRARSA